MELIKGGDYLSPRTGRPKAINPKSVDIKVRIDEQLNNKLLNYCYVNNITRAEAIRQGINKLLEMLLSKKYLH